MIEKTKRAAVVTTGKTEVRPPDINLERIIVIIIVFCV